MNLAYFTTFIQTCLLELPVYLFAFKGHVDWRKGTAVVFLINAVTHPAVFFGFASMKAPLISSLLLAETFAPAAEMAACVYIVGLEPRKALTVSLAANLLSWQVGPLTNFILFS